MMRVAAALLMATLALGAKEISLEWLETKPRSTPKDYYIWRYLHQDITPAQATQAIQMAKNVNRKLFYAYAKKAGPETRRIAECMRMRPAKLLKQDPACLAAGLSHYKLSLLSPKQIEKAAKKAKDYRLPPLLPLYLKKELTPQEFLRLFVASSKKYRKRLDRTLTPAELASLSPMWGFKSFVRYVAYSHTYPKLSASLLQIDPQKISPPTAFDIALIAIKQGDKKRAAPLLRRATKAYHQRDIDKANFWLWRVGDKNALQKLLRSWDLNIYTILAKESQNKEVEYHLVQDPQRSRNDIDLSDPFIWTDMKSYGKRSDSFYFTNTLPLYALYLERESRWKTHPFILPYAELLAETTISRKALIYAIARQESRFIPGSVSRSYALGLMQFMPFLAKETAAKLGIKEFNLDMMFEPKTAISFAQDHLDYLERHLKTPLFIAYAYNGGIGFFRRKALPLFRHYDPYLAMELVPYAESREYGKKVLANYYIYRKILGRPFRLTHYFQNLARPHHHDGGQSAKKAVSR